MQGPHHLIRVNEIKLITNDENEWHEATHVAKKSTTTGSFDLRTLVLKSSSSWILKMSNLAFETDNIRVLVLTRTCLAEEIAMFDEILRNNIVFGSK